MGALDVVIYAEGSRETERSGASRLHLQPKPTEYLPDSHTGPSHVLVRRSIAAISDRPEASVRFEAPLRLRTGVPRGSMLLNERVLKQVLTWPNPRKAPHLAIVFVDSDGDSQRKPALQAIVQRVSERSHTAIERILAVSVQEFETWLVADISAVNDALRLQLDDLGSPEALSPGKAKELLVTWCLDEAEETGEAEARRKIAENLDIQHVAERCTAFDDFLADLEGAVDSIDG